LAHRRRAATIVVQRGRKGGAMSDALLASVVISTYGRAAYLPRLVRALEEQTLNPRDFEVIVVDDASPDDTSVVLAKLAANSPLTLRVERRQTNAGPASGRNTGWRLARAPVVAFTDDDCQPAPSWLERGLAALDGAVDVVAGATHPNPDQLDRLGPYSRTMWPSFADTYPTCNVLYRRADLEGVGGFDEDFPYPGGEDTELAWRVRALGRTTSVVDDVVVYHDVHPGSFRAAVRDTTRWAAIPLLFRKCEDLREGLFARIFWKGHHRVLLALLGLALAPVTGLLSLVLTMPWVYRHLRNGTEIPHFADRVVSLPGMFLVDVVMVGVLARGSIRYRSLVL
jgi:glycosyltransferase involved in cell wall biosynthesis